ncbi:MAG: hypothetical protein AB7O38_13585 [Pirellulaceae bacterium]
MLCFANHPALVPPRISGRPLRRYGNLALRVALLCCSTVAASRAEVPGEVPTGRRPAGTASAADEPRTGRGSDSAQLRRWVLDLGADDFATRDEAMHMLMGRSDDAFPLLAEALGDLSAERRQRAVLLLARHDSFEQLAPHLLRFACTAQGGGARELLRDRCLQQVALAAELESVDRLFRLWDTTPDQYALQVDEAFRSAETTEQLSGVVRPLIELRRKASQFSDFVTRLNALAVTHDHHYSPGYQVTVALARGLRGDRQDVVQFALQFVESLESLQRQLNGGGLSRHAVREEIGNRTSWCQGATAYLVQLLDPQSPASQLLRDHVPIPLSDLHKSFFDGLAAPDQKEFLQGVGRVHVVDLLTSAMRQWPSSPKDGVAAVLKAQVVAAARDGDKPRALVLLEALDVCRSLDESGIELTSEGGRRLSQRVYDAAVLARHHRDFYPAVSVVNRLINLARRGVRPGHPAYPREYVAWYVSGDEEATAETSRAVLEKYTTLVERFSGWNVDWRDPVAAQLADTIRPRPAAGTERLVALLRRTDEMTADATPEGFAQRIHALAAEFAASP